MQGSVGCLEQRGGSAGSVGGSRALWVRGAACCVRARSSGSCLVPGRSLVPAAECRGQSVHPAAGLRGLRNDSGGVARASGRKLLGSREVLGFILSPSLKGLLGLLPLKPLRGVTGGSQGRLRAGRGAGTGSTSSVAAAPPPRVPRLLLSRGGRPPFWEQREAAAGGWGLSLPLI